MKRSAWPTSPARPGHPPRVDAAYRPGPAGFPTGEPWDSVTNPGDRMGRGRARTARQTNGDEIVMHSLRRVLTKARRQRLQPRWPSHRRVQVRRARWRRTAAGLPVPVWPATRRYQVVTDDAVAAKATQPPNYGDLWVQCPAKAAFSGLSMPGPPNSAACADHRQGKLSPLVAASSVPQGRTFGKLTTSGMPTPLPTRRPVGSWTRPRMLSPTSAAASPTGISAPARHRPVSTISRAWSPMSSATASASSAWAV